MPSFVHLFAPLALLLAPSQSAPAGFADPTLGPDSSDETDWSLALRIEGPPLLPADHDDPRVLGPGMLGPGTLDPEIWNQVRIEQHLTIRIYPGQGSRGAFFAPPPPTPPPHRDQKRVRCVALAAMGGVRLTGPNQLTLILHDERTVVATLPRICSTSAFYSGFYVEPTPDGMLCARRDMIHSRAGANCSISRLDMREGGN